MESKLTNKFNNIIHYQSEYVDSQSGGLKNIILKTFFEVEQNGMVLMDIWVSHTDFYNPNLEPHIYFKHQTAFELKNGQYLNNMELLEMFRFSESEFLNIEIRFDDNYNQSMKEIFKLNDQITDEDILETVKQGSSFISSLW